MRNAQWVKGLHDTYEVDVVDDTNWRNTNRTGLSGCTSQVQEWTESWLEQASLAAKASAYRDTLPTLPELPY